jgi:hypothetical protein
MGGAVGDFATFVVLAAHRDRGDLPDLYRHRMTNGVQHGRNAHAGVGYSLNCAVIADGLSDCRCPGSCTGTAAQRDSPAVSRAAPAGQSP